MQQNRFQRRHRRKQQHSTKPARILCPDCGFGGVIEMPEFSYCDGCAELHPAAELTLICTCGADMTLEWL